jgi:hypothetical protein
VVVIDDQMVMMLVVMLNGAGGEMASETSPQIHSTTDTILAPPMAPTLTTSYHH